MLLVKHNETGDLRVFKNVKSVLKYINSDRSDSWEKYTRHDWKEGLNEFTDYHYEGLVSKSDWDAMRQDFSSLHVQALRDALSFFLNISYDLPSSIKKGYIELAQSKAKKVLGTY